MENNYSFPGVADISFVHRTLSGSSPEDSDTGSTTTLNSSDMNAAHSNGRSHYYVNSHVYPKLQRAITSCKESLEEALNRLTGSENTVKPCSKLRAASFVLAYTVHEILGNATRRSTGLQESQLAKILFKLDAASLELHHLLKDAQTFLRGAHKFSDFCSQFLTQNRRQYSCWGLGRTNQVQNITGVSEPRNGVGSSDAGDIVWLLFVQEEAPVEFEDEEALPTFSQLATESKVDFLDCLIARYRLLVAAAHHCLINAQKAFSEELFKSREFLHFSIRRLNQEQMLGNNFFTSIEYREFIQEVLPVTRCLIGMSTSVAEITKDAENIVKLTESFLSKMRGNLFRTNYLYSIQCLDFLGSPASVIWKKIELRLHTFVTLLGVDTMAVVMEKGSLLLRKYPKPSLDKRLTVQSETESEDDPEEEMEDEGALQLDGLRSPMGDLPPFAEMDPGMLADPAAAVPGVEPFDLEVNMPQFTQEDIENNNFSGPTLIYLDFSHCPAPPPPEPDSPSPPDSTTSVINNNPENQNQPTQGQDPDGNFPQLFLSYHTINFVFLIYNWFSKHHPKTLLKLDEKVNESLRIKKADALKTAASKDKIVKVVRTNAPPSLAKSPSTKELAAQKAAVVNRRKSSIPFANRQARVRFNRIETMITSTKPGPHKPIVPGTDSEEELMKKIHSILKETEHPILVDLTLLTFEKPRGDTLSNDEMLLCITMVEWQSKIMAKADRHGRGAMDIISFPVAGDRVEAGSRLYGTLMMVADLMNSLTGEIDMDSQDNMKEVEDISKTVAEFVLSAEEILLTGKLYRHGSTSLFNKWNELLRKKGEFHLEHQKMFEPIYSVSMPENVTLYEDKVSNADNYEGALSFFWNASTMTISTDLDLDGKVQKISHFTQSEKLAILSLLLHHGIGLLITSDKLLKETLEVFQEPILRTGFDNIKSRVVGTRFDPNVDPLCALDLKNTLSELVQRNCELLNCAEKVVEILSNVQQFIRLLDRFTSQFVEGIKVEGMQKYQACFCCFRSKYVRFEDLTLLLGRLPYTDVSVILPQPSNYEVPIHNIRDDVSDMSKVQSNSQIRPNGDGSAGSSASTIYRLIQNSDAERDVLL